MTSPRCPDSRTSRLLCKPASLVWSRLDAPTRLVLGAVSGSMSDSAYGRIRGDGPSSFSDLRGKAAQYRGRYVARLGDALGTLARLGVPVLRVSEGRRVVLQLGRAYQSCASVQTWPTASLAECSSSPDVAGLPYAGLAWGPGAVTSPTYAHDNPALGACGGVT